MHRTMRAVSAASGVLLILAVALVTCYGDEYEIIFTNNSENLADVCIYQYDPDMEVQDVMSLAWITKRTAPTTTVRFEWAIDYCFVWSEQGELEPGLLFEASQIWQASVKADNKVKLMVKDGAYTFAELGTFGKESNLYIFGDPTLPVREAYVGIGVANAAIYVAPAQPNWQWIYTPMPMYWITFGSFEHQEVLEIESISNKASIQFQPGVFSMTAILNHDNTWTIFETPTDV